MSASQSILDTSRYGYDIVVATTQLGINSTMKLYLSEQSAPVVTCCYVGDGTSSQPIDYELLKKQTGADPFAVPDGESPDKNQDLINLSKAGFLYGFRLQIGLPPVAPEDTPDIVGLGNDATHVRFNLLSTELDVVGFVPATGSNSVRSWSSLSQSYPGDSLWIFQCAADLRLDTVPPAKYGTLPEPVKQRLSTVQGAFSIQQLFLDLSTATLVAIPDVKEWAGTPLAWMLQNYFVDVYVAQLRALIGDPVLNCSIIQQPKAVTPTELPITSMSREVSAVVGPDGAPVQNPTAEQQDITTLDYLCAIDDHKLNAPYPFNWNWVDATEKREYDGVVAINRASLAEKIRQQMIANVMANCYQPYVRVSIEWWSGNADITMSVTPGGQPTVDLGAIRTGNSGETQILKFTYHGHDQDAGDPSWYGTATLDTYYTATVRVRGNTITVEQNQRFDAAVSRMGATTNGSPISIKRVDTCTIDVTDDGQLVAVMATPTPAVNNASQSIANWWGDMIGGSNSLYSSTAAVVGGTVATVLNIAPFTFFQYLVFPGGQTFSYDSVAFADLGDLVTHIVYADPDGIPPDMSLLPGQVRNGVDRLNDGQWLANDGYLASPNGQFAAYLQDDGNFVLLHATDGIPDLSRPYWSIFANATDKIVGPFTGIPCYASLQPDGNFVLYNGPSPLNPATPYWAINTGLPQLGSFAALMKDDGTFVVCRRDPKSNALGEVIYQTAAATTLKSAEPRLEAEPRPKESGKETSRQEGKPRHEQQRKHDHVLGGTHEELPPKRGPGR
ncbi:hypothetical protein G6045_09700 [Streptomyces sp. YC504]|uniref:Bulb-type lectin domain-containing protein n=1 Tax=Streptomyces mesophilus TaxID=1775132 RepID=A0A6G4XGV0_9ACTN|nr:hypothetical protein [Streptomyces mesophilus]NGO75944.1 hypothetical protein [Streptomyces mesophilus]